jgi:membrane peptidoglycan carboxypeptidase
MVAAYGVLANDGIKVSQNFIQKIVTGDGTVLEENKEDGERILETQVARLVSDILSDNNARGPVFGYNSSLYLPDRQVAAKTGTTQENRDGWLIGYTPSLVAGVWTGNNNNESMTKQGAGLSAAGPMWNEFMRQALEGTPPERFAEPDPITTDKIMLDGSYQGPDGIHSILFYINKNDPGGSFPSVPGDDPQFKNWEEAVQRWLTGATL